MRVVQYQSFEFQIKCLNKIYLSGENKTLFSHMFIQCNMDSSSTSMLFTAYIFHEHLDLFNKFDHRMLLTWDHGFYVVYISKKGFAYALGGVSDVASFITTDEQLFFSCRLCFLRAFLFHQFNYNTAATASTQISMAHCVDQLG